jgi:magnesium transporter
MSTTKKIEFPNFYWLDIENPDEKDINQLAEKYKFHPLDIADCLSKNHRSRIDSYPKYNFLILLLPLYNPKDRSIKAAEFDIFISNGYIVTMHKGQIDAFNDFFNLFRISPDLRDRYSDKSPERLLYEMINKLFTYCFPIIDHLNQDCDNIEKAIFSGKERHMVSEILIIRRNITDIRRIMQVHKNVLKKLIYSLKESQLFVIKKTDAYFESLVDNTKEIWDTLENLKERIEALQQTNESQISFRLNDIMRILTIISVITFPVTLLATIFGMNTIHSMPFINNPYGFWVIISIMITIALTMLTIFKKKGWV